MLLDSHIMMLGIYTYVYNTAGIVRVNHDIHPDWISAIRVGSGQALSQISLTFLPISPSSIGSSNIPDLTHSSITATEPPMMKAYR